MTYLRGSRAAYHQLSYDLRYGPRAGEVQKNRSPLFRSRLLEVVKPWLIVVAFLLILGLVGGIETGTVWP